MSSLLVFSHFVPANDLELRQQGPGAGAEENICHHYLKIKRKELLTKVSSLLEERKFTLRCLKKMAVDEARCKKVRTDLQKQIPRYQSLRKDLLMSEVGMGLEKLPKISSRSRELSGMLLNGKIGANEEIQNEIVARLMKKLPDWWKTESERFPGYERCLNDPKRLWTVPSKSPPGTFQIPQLDLKRYSSQTRRRPVCRKLITYWNRNPYHRHLMTWMDIRGSNQRLRSEIEKGTSELAANPIPAWMFVMGIDLKNNKSGLNPSDFIPAYEKLLKASEEMHAEIKDERRPDSALYRMMAFSKDDRLEKVCEDEFQMSLYETFQKPATYKELAPCALMTGINPEGRIIRNSFLNGLVDAKTYQKRKSDEDYFILIFSLIDMASACTF